MLDLDAQPDTEVSLVELAVGHWMYWMQFADADRDTFQKVLVPIDRTKETEMVLPKANKLLHSEGDGILLHVIRNNREVAAATGGNNRGSDLLGECRAEVMAYLTELAGRLGDDSKRWRCDVIEATSVAEGVATYAAREGVDFIVMNTHERKGLAKLTRRSIAKQIKQKTPVGARIFRSCDLAPR
jgi:nucleotide-binding universal stress UspA family protein